MPQETPEEQIADLQAKIEQLEDKQDELDTTKPDYAQKYWDIQDQIDALIAEIATLGGTATLRTLLRSGGTPRPPQPPRP